MRVLCGTSQFTILMCIVQLSVVSLLVAPLRIRIPTVSFGFGEFGAPFAVRRSPFAVRANFFFFHWTFTVIQRNSRETRKVQGFSTSVAYI